MVPISYFHFDTLLNWAHMVTYQQKLELKKKEF